MDWKDLAFILSNGFWILVIFLTILGYNYIEWARQNFWGTIILLAIGIIAGFLIGFSGGIKKGLEV